MGLRRVSDDSCVVQNHSGNSCVLGRMKATLYGWHPILNAAGNVASINNENVGVVLREMVKFAGQQTLGSTVEHVRSHRNDGPVINVRRSAASRA